MQPTGFAFSNVTGVPVSTVQVSDAVEVQGLTSGAYVPVVVGAGGKYSINGDPFTTKLGYVTNGDMVMVEQTSASTPSTKVTTVLKIGGLNSSISPWLICNPVTATFSSTTE